MGSLISEQLRIKSLLDLLTLYFAFVCKHPSKFWTSSVRLPISTCLLKQTNARNPWSTRGKLFPKPSYSLSICHRYRKSSIKPPGGLFNFGPSRGGLNREGGLLERGGLFTKSSDKDIFGSFSVLLSHNLRNQGTILRLKYVNSTQFLFQNMPKLTCKVV